MSSVLVQILRVLLVAGSAGAAVPAEEHGGAARHGAGGPESAHRDLSAHRDMVSISMFREYERFSTEPRSLRDGNTVRSFKAAPSVSQGKDVFQFNLSSIQESESILFASFHFLYKRPRHQTRHWRYRRPRHGGPHPPEHPPSPQLLFRGASPNSSATALGNVTLSPFKRGSWQTRDITAVLRHARDANEPVVTAEFVLDFGAPRSQQRDLHGPERLSPANRPYILVYADDTAIDEPNSVAASLQRYGSFPAAEDASLSAASLSAARIRRELPLQIQTNDIPEVQFNTLKNHELWQSTYFPAKAKEAVKPGRKPGQEGGEAPSRPQVLSFDERTMKKARRRQWSEPRVCSRRYLRVDFADIGWSEWVLAPKSFDAFYCAGTCGFPIPKVVRPSNHATIQSIVRAVGIVPGVPEPCCVPEKMSPLSVLFLDPHRNMVLKVYPGMSVDTCSCR
ncbi:growth/differentiation factor 10 [Genypterus blacodes]|uniref:growth/differentiation factor 10 n=1 Tax=Genypterus blacodes TaxID=154954 RepID=UPI003F773CA2